MSERVHVEVRYRNISLLSHAALERSDEGGFLHTKQPMPVGTTVMLHAGEAQLTASVVQVVEAPRKARKGEPKPKPGMVLRFEDADPLFAAAAEQRALQVQETVADGGAPPLLEGVDTRIDESSVEVAEATDGDGDVDAAQVAQDTVLESAPLQEAATVIDAAPAQEELEATQQVDAVVLDAAVPSPAVGETAPVEEAVAVAEAPVAEAASATTEADDGGEQKKKGRRKKKKKR